jgi:hypothetical protein
LAVSVSGDQQQRVSGCIHCLQEYKHNSSKRTALENQGRQWSLPWYWSCRNLDCGEVRRQQIECSGHRLHPVWNCNTVDDWCCTKYHRDTI